MGEGTVFIQRFNLPFEHFSAVIIGCDGEMYYAQTEDDIIKLPTVGGLLLWDDERSMPRYCGAYEHNVFNRETKERVPIYYMNDGRDYYWLRQEVYRREIAYQQRSEEGVLEN
jgi:hypothetical protein